MLALVLCFTGVATGAAAAGTDAGSVSQNAAVLSETGTEPAEETFSGTEAESESVEESESEKESASNGYDSSEEESSSAGENAVSANELESGSAAPSQQEVNQEKIFTYEFTDMTVEVQLENPESLPAGVSLLVNPVYASQDDQYDRALKDCAESFRELFEIQARNDGIEMFEYLAYEIRFVREDQIFRPEGRMNVTCSFHDGLVLSRMSSDASNVGIYCLTGDNGNEWLNALGTEQRRIVLDENGGRIMSIGFALDESVSFAVGSNNCRTAEFLYEDDTIAARVTVDRPDEAIMDAELVVSPVDGNSLPEAAKEMLSVQEESLAGYLAYDIRLMKDGNEIEPSGTVSVSLTFKDAVKPEGAVNGEVALTHVKEENGSLQLEPLPDASIQTTEDACVQNTEFVVDSFSVFLLTWKSDGPSSGGDAPSAQAAEEPLRVIDTQTTGDMIDMTLFNYNPNNYSEQMIGGGYQSSGVSQNLLKPELDGNGMPVTAAGKSLSMLFDSNTSKNKTVYTSVDGLFYRDSQGYYYYNSAENYAYYNKNSGKFEVYNWIGGVNFNAQLPSYAQGNFFPFNRLAADSKTFSAYGTDENGKMLHNLTTGTGSSKADNGFGMKMQFDFVQPAGGRVNGQDMVFEFKGDDDVFVFIDGKLVLDLGGSHEALGGSINFATGEVWVEKVAGKGQNVTTTLSERLGYSLEDWSTHSLTFFYTDRGGASNCKIKFNITAIPKDSVSIRKEITNINEGIYSDVDFYFRLYVEDENGELESQGARYALLKNTDYVLHDTDDSKPAESGNTGELGVFTLKHGQTAVFQELVAKGKTYIVEEIGVSQDQYDQFYINNVELSNDKGQIVPSEQEGLFNVRSYPLKAGTVGFVLFKNTCSALNQRSLSVIKQMKEGQAASEEFHMAVTVGGRPYSGYYSVKDANGVTTTKTAVDGILSLKADETASIGNIPSGTAFTVQEVLEDQRFKAPLYAVTGADEALADEGASGRLKLHENAVVTVTNEWIVSKLTLTKTIDRLYDVNGDAVFTFRITCPDGTVLYHTFRFTGESGTTQSYTLENMPVGEYLIEELDTMRYTCQGTVDRTVILQDENGGTAEYTNNRTYESNFSHTDVVVNKISVGADGNIAGIQQDTLGKKSEGKEQAE